MTAPWVALVIAFMPLTVAGLMCGLGGLRDRQRRRHEDQALALTRPSDWDRAAREELGI